MPANRKQQEPTATAPLERWMTLGDLLEERRRDLGYATRPALARKGVIQRQLAGDIETASGDRINRFEPGELRLIAQAYAVTYESVLAFLHGEARELTPVRDTASRPRPAGGKYHAIDTAAPERWRLLGRLFRRRRVMELGFRYRPAFAEAMLPKTAQGNLMVRAVNAIENGERPTYTEETMAMYARAYEVTEASVYAVLEGRADKLEPAPSAPPPAAAAPPPGLPPAPQSELLREDADRPYFTSIWDRLLDLADRGISEPDGAQLGLGEDDAKLWDGSRGAMSRSNRAWLVADIQRRRGERAAERNGNADTA